jgi:Zn-dependent metalloprotease
VIAVLLLLAVLGQSGADAFASAFPGAETSVTATGGRLTHASAFRAEGLGEAPEATARAFLARHGAAFGVGPGQELVLQYATEPGSVGPVKFSRRIGQLPVFDGDLTVGLDAQGAVILVNAGDVPPAASGRFRISRKAAIERAQAAIQGLKGVATPTAERGWRAAGATVRPVWRVDFLATQPPGEWRTYVDADSGKVLQRTNLRVTGGP